MGKVKIGSLLEIKTPKGYAYLHYVYKDDDVFELIRVLPGIHPERPDNFDEIVKQKESYLLGFPVTAAVNKKILEKVGFYPIEGFTKPKYMRTDHIVRGEFLGWHIVNTSDYTIRSVKELSPEEKKLSPWGVWNDTLLIERLMENWSLETWT